MRALVVARAPCPNRQPRHSLQDHRPRPLAPRILDRARRHRARSGTPRTIDPAAHTAYARHDRCTARRLSTTVLDPGHGGHDSAGNSTPHGVRGPHGTLEKHVTLELARRISRQLGPNVVLTRDGDTNLSLAERAAVAARHGARVFLSLHTNASDAGDRGPEVFVHAAAGEPSLALARAVSHGAPHRDVLAADMAAR